MHTKQETQTDVQLDHDVYVAGDFLPVLFKSQREVNDLPDRSASLAFVTDQDKDELLSGDPMALLSWIARHDISIAPVAINGMANEYMAPVLLSTASHLIRRPVGSVSPRVRIGRVYLFDIEPQRRTDPPVLVMLPHEEKLRSAWDTYYHAVRSQISLMHEGARRVIRRNTTISLMRGLTQTKVTESTGHAERAQSALDRAYRHFVGAAPGVLAREELVFVLKHLLDKSLSVGKLAS